MFAQGVENQRMECQRIQDLLSEYINGALQAQQTALVETHLSHCDTCRQDLQGLRRAVATLRVLPPLTPPAYFVHAVQARIGEKAPAPQSTLPRWLFPNTGGFAIRLVAACILLASLFPPVRQPVVHGAWGLVYRMGFTATPPPQPAQIMASADPVPLLAPPIPAGDAAPTVDPAKPATSEVAPPVSNAPGILAPTPGVVPVPMALHRPNLPEASLQFSVDGPLQPGSVISISVAATGHSDFFGASLNASVSPGAEFVSEGGGSPPNRRELWSGNLPIGIPTSSHILLKADRPGLYDLRIAVNNGRADVASSDLLLPIGLDGSAVDIDTSRSGPTDLYTALTTLASQSSHPVAVEDGLTGTRSLSLHVANFSAGLQSIADEFGCSSSEKGNVGYVALHPERGTRASNQGN